MRTKFYRGGLTERLTTRNGITDPSIVVKMQNSCEEVYVDRSVREYMVDIVARTREDPRVLVGSSPRGSQALEDK